MTIVAMKLVRPFKKDDDDEDRIGVKLWARSMHHWTRILGVNSIGVGYDSCNAAVAIDPRPGTYDTEDKFSIIYGSSRLYSGIDPQYNAYAKITKASCSPFSSSILEQHAEQTAIRTAEASGVPFWNHDGHYHVYVDFNPCDNCEPWLEKHKAKWYVHHYTWMEVQELAIEFKREIRRDDFGSYKEPRPKKKLKL
jgi:Cytidine and deoxycytidylate deaminase zinc-binding region